jgi:hypothetical protein
MSESPTILAVPVLASLPRLPRPPSLTRGIQHGSDDRLFRGRIEPLSPDVFRESRFVCVVGLRIDLERGEFGAFCMQRVGMGRRVVQWGIVVVVVGASEVVSALQDLVRPSLGL